MRPQNEAELADVISGAQGPLAVRGGATRGVSLVGDELSVAGLSGITLYEPAALTLVVQVGTPVDEVRAVLAEQKQRLAFEPMDHRALLGTSGTPTMGALFAGNISGPRRIQAGAARDFALGVRFVDGLGRVISNGGRVMKNVTGYDLVKLMCGAWGSLGVLTEVSLKVLPMPETEATLSVRVSEPALAVDAMSAALGSPFDVTGAAWTGEQVLIRLEGFEGSVRYRAGQLREQLSKFGEISEAQDSAAVWVVVRDVSEFAAMDGDVWRVSVKPSDGPAVIAAAGGSGMMDWGGGLVWLCVPTGTDVRSRLAGVAGHATLVRGQGFARLHPEPSAVAEISGGLRAKFDPRGILSQEGAR